MTSLTTVIRTLTSILLLAGAGSLAAQAGKESPGTLDNPLGPTGLQPPQLRVSGVRSSAQLATVVHCSNVDSVTVALYVSYFEYDGSLKCALGITDVGVGLTRSFTTADTAAFLEDAFCSPVPAIGQGRVEIATFPLNSKINCTAQIVSATGNPPTTLATLDIFRAN